MDKTRLDEVNVVALQLIGENHSGEKRKPGAGMNHLGCEKFLS